MINSEIKADFTLPEIPARGGFESMHSIPYNG